MKQGGTAVVRDKPTIVAISIMAYAASSVLHECVGHGGACLLSGGHAVLLSTVEFECNSNTRLIAAGGTLANLATAMLAWLAMRSMPVASGRLRYFLWLLMTINLLGGAGYFLFSGVGDFGDWADVVRDLRPAWAWRTGLVVLGAVSYPSAVWLALRELRSFLGETDWRRGAAKDLTIVPYVAGGLLCTIAGAVNPVGWQLVGLSAAAASFGGSSGLAWMTQCLGTRWAPKSRVNPAILQRSWGWILAALVAAMIFIGVMGRGLKLA